MKKIIAILLTAVIAIFASGCDAVLEYAGNEFEQAIQDELNYGEESGGYSSAESRADESDVQSSTDSETESKTESKTENSSVESSKEDTSEVIDEDGTYTSKEDVALYIHTYGKLPSNFMTKKEAQALGWEGGSLEPYAPGKCIGGSHFGNYEALLPEKSGREYTECDIDTLGASSRGAKRIVFSNDGLIYYTDDHYESFELLYGEE